MSLHINGLVYSSWFFYLLYKRKRWGWILVLSGIIMGIVGIPLQIYALSTYLRVLGVGRTGVNTMAGFVIQAVLMIAFAWYLWRQDVCELFLQSPRSGSASR